MFLVVALVLGFLVPWPWNLVAFLVGLALFVCELVFWHRRVRGYRKEVGAQKLIGQSATVISSCRPDGQVRVSGEIWAARCTAGADRNQRVRVVGRQGLLLIVETGGQQATS